MFFAVENSQRAILRKGADVTGVQPAFIVQSFSGLFRLFVVAGHDIGAFDAYFTFAIFHKVATFGSID